MKKARLQMICKFSPISITKSWGERTIHQGDVALLGELLYTAYHDTVDDEGETVDEAHDEAAKTIAGNYGDVLWECSFLLSRNNKTIGVTLVTNYYEDGIPLLAFSLTRPGYQRQGVAAHLISCSQAALLQHHNINRLRLVVTASNTPAVNLYQKIGFEVEK
jgi:ribosomal protein S18 acetylase RimI-like enzyme